MANARPMATAAATSRQSVLFTSVKRLRFIQYFHGWFVMYPLYGIVLQCQRPHAKEFVTVCNCG
jgi:hypothetical protein